MVVSFVKKHQLLSIVLILSTAFIVYIGYSILNVPPRTAAPNAKMVASIRNLQIAFALYAKDNNGLYPPVGGLCVDVENLEEFLVPLYIPSMPIPPARGVVDARYEVSVSIDKSKYVLKATPLFGNHPALENASGDVDGNVLSCDCVDPAYCLTNIDISQ